MCVALAASLVAATTVSFGGGEHGSALGPIRPITPDETNPQLDDGRDADLSRRGEAITVAGSIGEDRRGAFIGLDNLDLEVPFPAREVGVSGNGCVAAYITHLNADLARIATIDRCNPANSRTLDDNVRTSLGPFGQPAVDFDGSAVVVPWAEGITYYDIGTSVTRRDLPITSIPGFQPLTGGELYQSDNAVDVSADGNHVVATLANPPYDSNPIVAGWDVGASEMTVLSTADGMPSGNAHSPSISGDGRFVSFVSSEPLVGQPAVAGTGRSWVYVRPLATPVFTLVSPVDEYSTFSSISEDGSQVAFVTYVLDCSGRCPPRETVRVVWSATPGLTAPLQMEDINVAPDGIVASHGSPVLSGNGRFVAWDTNGGFVLVDPEFGDSSHVMLRERESGLTVSGVSFGAIAAGNSAIGTSTVTNTGRSSILVGQMLTTSAEFQVVGGSCGIDVWIPPGATCTVDVRFAAAPAGGPSSADLVVGEVGFQALSATGPLTGSSVPPTTTTAPTDTPPTTIPPPTTTQPPSTTDTVILSGSPNPLDFGQVAVGIPTIPLDVTITNGGNAAAPITLEVGGDHPDDYQIVSDTCRASPLAPGRSCTVSVRMLATAGGDRQALLVVTSGSASTLVALRGQGRFAPQISTSPATITERGITTIVGQGLPPGATLQLDIPPSTVTVTATADGAGIFQVPLGAFGTLPLGAYEVVLPAEPGVFDEVRANLLVVVGTFQPQGPTSAVFGDNLLVTRN